MTPTQFANFAKGAVELAKAAKKLGMDDIAALISKRITIEANRFIEYKPPKRIRRKLADIRSERLTKSLESEGLGQLMAIAEGGVMREIGEELDLK